MPNKHKIGFIKKSFLAEGYTLLNKEYTGCGEKLNYICPNKHKHFVSWDNWKQGLRCKYCKGKIDITYEYIKSDFEKENYILLTNKYENAHQKLEYICSNGHKHSISWNNWKTGQRCPYCRGRPIITIEGLRMDFAMEGYTLLTTEYKGAHSYVEYICPKGHTASIRVTSWRCGFRCTKCSNNVSRWEVEVKKFVRLFCDDIVENDKSIITNPVTGYALELDIWIPQLNKAIECNGSYWHSMPKRKILDSIKAECCRNKYVDLLVLKEEDWKDRQNLCKERIKKFILGG